MITSLFFLIRGEKFSLLCVRWTLCEAEKAAFPGAAPQASDSFLQILLHRHDSFFSFSVLTMFHLLATSINSFCYQVRFKLHGLAVRASLGAAASCPVLLPPSVMVLTMDTRAWPQLPACSSMRPLCSQSIYLHCRPTHPQAVEDTQFFSVCGNSIMDGMMYNNGDKCFL